MKYLLFLFLLAPSFFAIAQKPNPSLLKATDLYNKTIVQIKPAFKNYVAQTAKAFTHRKLNIDSLKSTIKTPGNSMFSNLNEVDISTLMFLVMEATKAELDADIKNMMAAMEKNNQKKEALREEEKNIQEAAKTAEYRDMTNMTGDMQKNRQQKDTPPVKADSNKIKKLIYTADQAKRLAKIKDEKDSISEMGEQDMLQLQQMMEKKAQLEQMISNVMKAATETQSGLSGNLKG